MPPCHCFPLGPNCPFTSLVPLCLVGGGTQVASTSWERLGWGRGRNVSVVCPAPVPGSRVPAIPHIRSHSLLPQMTIGAPPTLCGDELGHMVGMGAGSPPPCPFPPLHSFSDSLQLWPTCASFSPIEIVAAFPRPSIKMALLGPVLCHG